MSEEYKPVDEILVPMDFSECSVKALDFAKRIASACQARLHLLYVDDEPLLLHHSTDQSFRDEHEKKMAKRFIDLLTPEECERFRCLTAVRLGSPCTEIEKYAAEESIELIIMGHVGRSAMANILLGSVTSHVLRRARCPVLSVTNQYECEP